MLLHVVNLIRLVKDGYGGNSTVDEVDGAHEIVAENARDADCHVNPRMNQFVRGNNLEGLYLTGIVPDGYDSEKREYLSHHLAVGGHDIAAHPVERHIFGIFAFLVQIFVEKGIGKSLAHTPCRGRRHLCRIERVEVPAARENVDAAAYDKPRGSGGDIAAVKPVHKGIHLF